MSTQIKDNLITEAELANWLNVSKSTLHKLREDGDLPHRLIGTCIRYSTLDIDAWLKGRSVNSLESNEQNGPPGNSMIFSTADFESKETEHE